MWFNYFKIAWRNLLRSKLRSTIHILGLGIGIAACFLVYNVVSYSYSFDIFHPQKDNIFQVTTLTRYQDQSWPNTGVPFPLAEVVNDEISGVLDKSQFYTLEAPLVTFPSGGKSFGRTNGVVFSDAGFFRIFQREWLAGNLLSAMDLPNSVVITESSLNKYFSGLAPWEALGKELLYIHQDSMLVQITGVVKDYTENSDITFTDFISLNTIPTLKSSPGFHMENWDNVNSNSQLFLLLENPGRTEDVQAGLDKIEKKYIKNEEGGQTDFFIQPLSSLHFTGPYSTQRADKTVLRGLMGIGMIILLIACMNFINLETAQAIYRNKEVGIRKTLGSNRKQLILQFLVETYIFVFMGIAVSFLLSEGATHYLKDYLPDDLRIDLFSLENILFLIGISILLTILSGLYPALILSKYKPDSALKSSQVVGGKLSLGLFFRKNLTVIQFTLSIMFVIGVFTINKQMGFLSSQELGFDKEWVAYARAPFRDSTKGQNNLLIKKKLEQQSFVQAVSLSSDMVASQGLWTSRIEFDLEKEKRELEVQVKEIDQDFFRVNGLNLMAGRNIHEVPEEVLINEALTFQMGFTTPREAVGKSFEFNEKELRIVGVIQNFHSRTLRETIRPLIMFYESSPFQVINVRLASGTSLLAAKNTMDLLYKEVYPVEDVQFAFLDETVEKFYEEDAKLKEILSLACGLAILISCMGLFGLTSFTISRRLKEISIRKVLGATVFQILYLVSKEYLLLMGIAFILGCVPAWLFLDHWLKSFSFRIEMPWILFGAAGFMTLILCLLIVGVHSLKAAQKNPAEILKSE
jgi:ABC-type antimicrobial peptide transport system permease subunit